MKIKILFNSSIIDCQKHFQDKIEKFKNKYGDNFTLEEKNNKKFDLLIDDRIVYTLDDSFNSENVSTKSIIEKVERHIYNAISSKRKKNVSKFDDVDLIDY